MNKIFIVLLFILLGSSLIAVNNIKGTADNSFKIVYENNKNLGLPDLTGKTEILVGVYRVFDNRGITIDYDIYNGYYVANGQATNAVLVSNYSNAFIRDFSNISGNLTLSFIYVSGSGLMGFRIRDINNENGIYIDSITVTQYDTYNYLIESENFLRVITQQDQIFDNFTFKLQIEKGSQATSYVVPKLVPHYVDNLSQQEKQKIGIGAFGGITQIINTINNIIEPIGDFINGILSWF